VGLILGGGILLMVAACGHGIGRCCRSWQWRLVAEAKLAL
jgi:hypothetical protein